MESDQCWALLNYSFLQESRYQNICFMLLIIDSVKRGWQKLISMPTARFCNYKFYHGLSRIMLHILLLVKTLQYIAMFCYESDFCWQIAPTSLQHQRPCHILNQSASQIAIFSTRIPIQAVVNASQYFRSSHAHIFPLQLW